MQISFTTRNGERLDFMERPAPHAYPKWGIVRLDYDTVWPEFGGVTHVSRPKRNNSRLAIERGLPATARFAGGTRIPFTQDLQLWIHGLCGGTGNTYKSDFASLWREGAFMSNDSGTNNFADYINNTNLNKGLPKLEPMAAAGTWLRITGEDAKHYEFEAINAYSNYRSYSPMLFPWLFFHPTTSRRELHNGTWDESISLPFSQYDNKAIIPIFAHGDSERNKIEKYRVQIIDISRPIPSPYKTRGFQFANPYADLRIGA